MPQIEKQIIAAAGEYVVRVETERDMDPDNVRLYRNRVRVLPSRVGEGVCEWRGHLTSMDMIEASTGDWSPLRLTIEPNHGDTNTNQP